MLKKGLADAVWVCLFACTLVLVAVIVRNVPWQFVELWGRNWPMIRDYWWQWLLGLGLLQGLLYLVQRQYENWMYRFIYGGE